MDTQMMEDGPVNTGMQNMTLAALKNRWIKPVQVMGGYSCLTGPSLAPAMRVPYFDVFVSCDVLGQIACNVVWFMWVYICYRAWMKMIRGIMPENLKKKLWEADLALRRVKKSWTLEITFFFMVMTVVGMLYLASAPYNYYGGYIQMFARQFLFVSGSIVVALCTLFSCVFSRLLTFWWFDMGCDYGCKCELGPVMKRHGFWGQPCIVSLV